MRLTVLASAAAISAAAALTAHAAEIEVIYTKINGSPTAIVPGALDLAGLPAVTEWRAMETLRVSPDGTKWVLRGRTQLGSDLETVLVAGSGTVGTMLSQEGQPIPTGAPGELFDFFGSDVGSFNTSNDFAYAARARGGVASVFHKVLVWDGVSQSIAFQMGDLYTGLVDNPVGSSGDETVGNSVGSIHILDDGTIGSQDSTVLNISTTRRPVLTYDRVAFQQTNITTINGLGGVGTQTWQTIDANEFRTTPDGAHWMAEGEINTPPSGSLAVLVRNGDVVLQEGQPVSTSGLTLGDIAQSVLLTNGDWFARGRDNSGTGTAAPDWVVRNGDYIAKTGDPTHTGAADNWGDTIYAVTGNRVGDYVVAGNSSGASATNDVVVLNGAEVVLREGDPVDVDGNGLFDDDAFVGRGNDTLTAILGSSLYLTDDRMLYLIINLRDAAGNDRNGVPVFGSPNAFVRLQLPGACPGERGDANCDGGVDFFDIDPFLQALFDPAGYAAAFCGGEICAVDVDCSGGVDFFDIDPFLDCLFSTCPPCP